MSKTPGLVGQTTDVNAPVGGQRRKLINNGDGTVAELTTSKSTAGPPTDGQVGITLVGQAVNPAGSITNVDSGSPYTPTYRFFITDINVTSNSGTQFEVQILSGGTIIYRGFCKGDTGPIQLLGIETQPTGAPGQAITLTMTVASTTVDWFIAGFEQNAGS